MHEVKKYCYDCIRCIGGWTDCYCEVSGAPLLPTDTIDDGGDCRPCRLYEYEEE